MQYAPLEYREIFDLADFTAFARAVELLKPGASGSDIAAMLDHKATRFCVLNWKAGRANPPKWALELLAAKIRAQTEAPLAIADELERLPERAGRKAGTRNIMAYNARR